MGCRAWSGTLLVAMGLAFLMVLMASDASGDPDPPHIDGGTAYLDVDWTVDPGDRLAYYNQTIVLTGNLTVADNATLDLVNCTLVVNSSSPDHYHLLVRSGGGLNITTGSEVRRGVAADYYYWNVWKDAHLLVEDSTVDRCGSTAGPLAVAGLRSLANDTVVRGTAFVDCYVGVVLDGITGGEVADCAFSRGAVARYGLVVMDSSGPVLENLTFDGLPKGGRFVNCSNLVLANLTVNGGGPLPLDIDNTSATVVNGAFRDVKGGLYDYTNGGYVNWTVAGPSASVNCTILLKGSLDVRGGGVLDLANTSLRLWNPSVNGTNGITVRSGGAMGLASGSQVENEPTDRRYYWTVEAGGRLSMEDATVKGAGWNSSNPGLVVVSSGNSINRSVLEDCHVGLTVTGSNNTASDLVSRRCDTGVRWEGGSSSLANLTVEDCIVSGVVVQDADGVSFSDLFINHSGTSSAFVATSSDGLSIRGLVITGPPASALTIRACSNVSLEDVNASASGRVLVVDGRDAARNVSLSKVRTHGGTEAIWTANVSDVWMSDVVTAGSSTSGLVARDVAYLLVTRSVMNGTSGPSVHILRGTNVSLEGCRFSGQGTLVRLEEVTGAYINSSLLATAETGVDMRSCLDAELRDVSVQDMFRGVIVHNSSRVTVASCHLQLMSIGISVDNGSYDCTIVDLSVVDVFLAAEVRASSYVSLRRLSLVNCTSGASFDRLGPGNRFTDTELRGLGSGVSVTDGSNLTIINCSFYDCVFGISTDQSSGVEVQVTGGSEMVNCTSGLAGRIRVLLGGSLNISGATVNFYTDVAGLNGISSELGSTLRIVNGSVMNSSRWNHPYTIVSNGTLVVRDSSVLRGGVVGGEAAVTAAGGSAVIDNVTLSGCQLALSLRGAMPTVSNCRFEGNVHCIRLSAASQVTITGCRFRSTVSTWEVRGEFEGSLVVRNCTFEGGGRVWTAIHIDTTEGKVAPFTMVNVTLSDYTVEGLDDGHDGPLTMRDCRLRMANASVGAVEGNQVRLEGLDVTGAIVSVGPAFLTARDCTFTNGTLKVHNSSAGSRVLDCTFSGGMADGSACLEVDDSLLVEIANVTVDDAPVGLLIVGGSEVDARRLQVRRPRTAAVEVIGSIVRLEGCSLTGISGTGIRSWNPGSRVEVRNTTLVAAPGRTGLDVDASGGGDIWLLNTTFDTSSVNSSAGGRVEVLWFVSVRPVLPWGGDLWDPESLTVTDAIGTEVVNTTRADEVMLLYQFSEEDGVRAWHTPHAFHLWDGQQGLEYIGTHTINSSAHLVLTLVDVSAPVARAGPDEVIDEDVVLRLDGTGTSDNDPTFNLTGSFRWTFDEHGTEVVLDGAIVRYVFSVPGKFWVNLTVVDAAGNVGTDTLIVQVRDLTAPTIRFNGNVTVEEDEVLIFDASATADNDPLFDATTGTFQWQVVLGNGPLEREGASFANAFPDPGNYSGSLRVWDRAGNMAQVEFWVRVLDITPPVFEGVNDALVFTATGGLLDASGCYDNVGIVAYEWVVTYEFEGGEVRLSGEAPAYVFDRLGTYTVTLVLTDGAANSNSTHVRVVYDDVPQISMPDWAVAMAGERLEVPIQVVNVYSEELTLRVVEGPEGTRVDPEDEGTYLVWTPEKGSAGSDVLVEVEVFDGFISSQASINILVNPARGTGNHAPVVLSTPPRGAKRATPYVYRLEAEDEDGDVLWYVLVDGPEGMTISRAGTLSWDPPYDHGTVLVDVRVDVTDGRDVTTQSWTVRWRDPPNSPPSIPFTLPPHEARVMEGFQVDLSVHIQDPGAYDVDEDDPNHALEWSVQYDEAMVTLVDRDGLVFHLQALDGTGTTLVTFVVLDPSGESDMVGMELNIERPPPPADQEAGWLLWAILVLTLVIVSAAAVATLRRGGRRGDVEPPGVPRPDRPAPHDEGGHEGTPAAAVAKGAEATAGVGAFVELEGGTSGDAGASGRAGPVDGAGVTRVVASVPEGDRRLFDVEGVALLDGQWGVLASTGPVEEVIGPYQEVLDHVRSRAGGDGIAIMETEGRRVLLASREGTSAICLVRGREDGVFREELERRLEDLVRDTSEEPALAAIEDIVSSATGRGRAEVVQGAWTSRVGATLEHKGSLLVLNLEVRNETEHILNNARLHVEHDEDALTMDRTEPKLLVTRGVLALGNVPPRKRRRVAITFMPELCISSVMRVVVTYTDLEGQTVFAPSRALPVRVECPFIEAGGQVDEGRVLAMAEDGLGHKGFRVLTYGLDVDHERILKMAVQLVAELGPMKVIDLEDRSLMRAEAWFMGAGQGGVPQVLVRVSSHGADRLLELFVTSDEGATATGLLTHLMVELLDRAASEMPGKRVERVRDSTTLEEIEVWPSLLDYKVMED